MSDAVKLLFLAAMGKEIKYLIQELALEKRPKLLGVYPSFASTRVVDGKETSIAIVETYVGDANASTASLLAIQEFDPDYVLKIGCIGGNSAGIHKGDIVLPSGYFHSASWITRSNKDNSPSSDASVWQSLFGGKPYQVNSKDLGEMPYFFLPDKELTSLCENVLDEHKIPYETAYIGGGNMWFFDKALMANVAETQLPKNVSHARWGADMESYVIAHNCFVTTKPFTGFYVVSNSDYYDEPYIPDEIAGMFQSKIFPVITAFLESF